MKTGYWYLPVLFCILCLAGCAAQHIAGGKIKQDTLRDGTYHGSASQGPVKVTVTVTVEQQRISAITLLSHRTWKGKAAEKTIPQRIIMEQSTRVDGVSGATMSSVVIMNAVEDALSKAR